MDHQLKIATIQFDIQWQDIDHNLANLEEILYQYIVNNGYDIVVLPEMFTTGFGSASAQNAEFMHGKTHKWLQNMSKACNALMMGSVPIKEHGKSYNRLICAFPDSSTKHYDKKHLFGFGEETSHFSQGNAVLQFSFRNFEIRPLICYDLRFPVWSINNPKKPYDILVYVANWPTTRQHAWETLLKARAIENQSYVIACNRIGTDGNELQYTGGSTIIDYEGKSIARSMDEKNFQIFTSIIDKNKLENFRNEFPFINDMDEFDIK